MSCLHNMCKKKLGALLFKKLMLTLMHWSRVAVNYSGPYKIKLMTFFNMYYILSYNTHKSIFSHVFMN